MEIFILWVLLSIIVSAYATNKGLKAWSALVVSLILSPVVGFLLILVSKPNTAEIEKRKLKSGEAKKCPFCAELIKKEASVCRYCGKNVNEPEKKSSPQKESDEVKTWVIK